MKACVLCGIPAPGLCEICVPAMRTGMWLSQFASDMLRDEPVKLVRAVWARAGKPVALRRRKDGFRITYDGASRTLRETELPLEVLSMLGRRR